MQPSDAGILPPFTADWILILSPTRRSQLGDSGNYEISLAFLFITGRIKVGGMIVAYTFVFFVETYV